MSWSLESVGGSAPVSSGSKRSCATPSPMTSGTSPSRLRRMCSGSSAPWKTPRSCARPSAREACSVAARRSASVKGWAAAPRSGEMASAKSTPQRGRRARELSPRGRGAAHRQAGVSLRGRGRADVELVRVGRRADLDWAALTNALVDRARSEVRSRDARAIERRRRPAASSSASRWRRVWSFCKEAAPGPATA